jgi:acyl-CoA reductase-like NAD-dependent aldehyde dehydrogenase
MKARSATHPGKKWTASELRKLPAKQRSAILKAAAAMAEEDYRIDAELTAFEACGTGDLYGESSSTETRRNLVN